MTLWKKIPFLIFQVEEKNINDVWEYLTDIETPEFKLKCTVGLKFMKEKNADN